MAEKILMNELRALQKEKWVAVELDDENVFAWNVALMFINPDSPYNGGYFKAKMTFPRDYPYSPPDFKFNRALFHPNVYKDGKLCISILHPPVEDETSGESTAERWSPAQRVESVLLSILSLLEDAEPSSPANVDAGVMLRTSPEAYKGRVLADVAESRKDIPAGFVMPDTHVPAHVPDKHDDHDFWYDSDDGDDFGGSATDEEGGLEQDEDEDEDEAEDGYTEHEEEEEL